MRYLFLPAICLLLSLLGSCGASMFPDAPLHGGLPERWVLIQNLRNATQQQMILALPPEDQAPFLELFADDANQREEFVVKSLNFSNAKALQENPVPTVFLGMASLLKSHLPDSMPAIPFHLLDQGFVFQGDTCLGPEDLLIIRNYPHPWHPEMPATYLIGNDPGFLRAYFQPGERRRGRRMLRGGLDYELIKGDGSGMKGNFSRKKTSLWEWDKEIHWDFPATPVKTTDHGPFRFHVYSEVLSEAAIAAYGLSLEGEWEKLTDLFSGSEAEMPRTLHLFARAEDKAMYTESSARVSKLPDSEELAVVVNDYCLRHPNEGVSEAWVKALLGESPQSHLSSGIAVWVGEQWQGEGWKYWAARLAEAGWMPSAQALATGEPFGEENSPLIRACVSAAWVDYLMDQWGVKAFLAFYRSGQLPSEDSEWLTGWPAYLEALQKDQPTKPVGKKGETDFFKGFNFAHEGYSIFDGYLSRMAANSVDELKGLGANSLAIIPYTFMRDPKVPSALPVVRRSGMENDESIIHMFRVGEERNMQMMLKPQIWVRGSWPGEIDMASEEDWETFLGEYEYWIAHYALLAAIHEVDVFCVGVEMTQATLKHPSFWRDLIRKVRKVYSGKIVYAANWGKEFEEIAFWDEVDYLGIDCYYPLSQSKEASIRELRKNFEQVMKKIEARARAHDKPFLFTEIGFRSIEGAWREPHEHAGEALPSQIDQAKCYQAVVDVVKDSDTCEGIFWWKWSSYLDHIHPDDREYSPDKKLAAEEVQRLFSGR